MFGGLGGLPGLQGLPGLPGLGGSGGSWPPAPALQAPSNSGLGGSGALPGLAGLPGLGGLGSTWPPAPASQAPIDSGLGGPGGFGGGWPPAPSSQDGPHGVKRTAAEAWPSQESNSNDSGWNKDDWKAQGWTDWKSNSNAWKQTDGADNGWKSQSNSWNQEPEAVEEDIDEEAKSHAFAFLQPAAPLMDIERSSVFSARQAVEVVVKGEVSGREAPPITSFDELSQVVPPYVNTALAQAGIKSPFPIQQHTLPFTLRGFDVIGIAKTGSGKTLAFLLPAIAYSEMQPPMVYGQHAPAAVVMAPVRELADQIAEEAMKILRHSGTPNHPRGLGCVALYGGGGQVRRQQLAELNKGFCDIVVGTPGRMADFAQSGDLVFDRAAFFVLDEADRMLDGGFEDQINEVASKIRSNRQTLFFSATWPKPVRKLAKNMCRAPPMRVSIGQGADEEASGPTARSDITQEVIIFDGGPKRPWPDEVTARIEQEKTARMNSHLRACLANPMNKMLVFVNTKTMAKDVAWQLSSEGFKAACMSADLKQWERSEVIRRFKDNDLKLVVTTDVMARGLDIQGITHVLVYDCYGGIDDYVHRIGRTSRGLGGPGGHALVFYEFDPKYAQMPAEIIKLLQGAGQHVPPALQQIANEVATGIRKAVHTKQGPKKKNKW